MGGAAEDSSLKLQGTDSTERSLLLFVLVGKKQTHCSLIFLAGSAVPGGCQPVCWARSQPPTSASLRWAPPPLLRTHSTTSLAVPFLEKEQPRPPPPSSDQLKPLLIPATQPHLPWPCPT